VLIELALGHELPQSPTDCQLAKPVDAEHVAILLGAVRRRSTQRVSDDTRIRMKDGD